MLKMISSWIVVLTFSTVYTVEAGRRLYRDTAQFLTETPVYQPHKVILVDIGDSATLQCCIFKQQTGIVAWFKQTNSKKTKIIVKFFKNDGEILDTRTGSQVSRIQIESSSNCFNMTILHTIQSDKATYYCVLLTTTKPVFSNRTYLKIKGEKVTTASETSKPPVSDSSLVCEPTPHGNIDTQKKTVLGLGTALGFCTFLFSCLIYCILKRWKLNTSMDNRPETMRVSEAETLNYAALKFTKRKADSLDECVYSEVKLKVTNK
ncbi:uncharacterized protein LOC124385742 isoform X3 [Silurus meridionalis]|uniref:uncharacterized protein LOC124385742 isoform X3 n=1 Tax=Silurus meridionalis TaxID=175797 RepID=UPI001EEAF717|nr:uncharacterized protein LOC124385742 isoform X3 [Silurus meridionalis]XP_046704950.1 uncharacterized protein LOC124385742 isoform X3 [Silurus meridionalis]